jgi:hypothetical protein
MRYLVTARVKLGKQEDLADAIDAGTLGAGSVAGGEYLRNMQTARQLDDGRVQWVGSATAPRRCSKSGNTGKSTSTSTGCRTPTRAADAAI